jgi:hypothetical protein
MGGADRIPVLLVIDVEPDGFFVDPDARLPWRGFEQAWTWVQSARRTIAAATGAPAQFCWGVRLDAQVERVYGSAAWPLRHYEPQLADFLQHDDALGVHTHVYRWDEPQHGWVIEQGDPAWVEHNVRLSVRTFEDALGRRCDFFRFGDRWMSDAAMTLLDELGVRFDLSLEPGRRQVPSYHPDKPSTGFVPDQRAVAPRPYRPARGQFRSHDPARRAGLIEIPVTTAVVRPLDSLRARPTPACALEWLKHRLRPWIDTAGLHHEPRRFRSLVDVALEAGAPHLSLTVRTDSFTRNLKTGDLDRSIALLLAHPLAARFEFTTPARLVAGIAPDLADVRVPAPTAGLAGDRAGARIASGRAVG